MLQIKPGARIFGLRPEMILAVIAVESAYASHGIANCIITHAIDGTHSVGSEHYAGAALDFRMHNVPSVQRERLVQDIKEALGADYFVLWEAKGTPNEHLHIEFNPRQPYK